MIPGRRNDSAELSGQRARGGVPSVRPEGAWARLWKPFWAIPAACCVAAVAAGVGLPLVDEQLSTSLPYVFQGGPDGARSLLGTIASAMISVTGLVFSITMVILQLASSQYTPRVLGAFLQSRITQATLGVFIATFVFALTVIRYVRGGNETVQFVPQTSVTVAFLMVLASVGFFLAFTHFITTSIQVSRVVSNIGDRTLKAADRMYPEPAGDGALGAGPTWSPAPGTPRVALRAPHHGVVTHFDHAALVAWAQERDVVVTIDRPVGEFLTEGQEVLRVWGTDEVSPEDGEALYDYVGLGSERELRQDVAFGIRQLVDIAERALSPGINDPTTATQVVDEIHRVLRRLVQRASPSPFIADGDGTVRVVHEPQSVDFLIDLAVREIALYGEGGIQVPKRLRRMLEDLLSVAAPRYVPALEAQLSAMPEPARVGGGEADAEGAAEGDADDAARHDAEGGRGGEST